MKALARPRRTRFRGGGLHTGRGTLAAGVLNQDRLGIGDRDTGRAGDRRREGNTRAVRAGLVPDRHSVWFRSGPANPGPRRGDDG